MRIVTVNAVRRSIILLLCSTALACQAEKITQPVRNDIIVFRNGMTHPGGAIYLLALDGSAPIELASGSTFVTCPIVSPDGKRIAFVRGTPADTAGAVTVMDIDGRNIARVTPFLFSRHAPSSASQGPDPYWQLRCPSWSPDSKRLSVIRLSQRNKAPAASELYAINVDGTGLRLLATGDTFDATAWSPVADRILLDSHLYTDGGAYGYSASVVNADGSGSRPISKSVAGLGWAPSGKSVAVLCGRDYTTGGRQLCVGDPDGEVVALTDSSLAANSPAWAPDGTRIAFGCKRVICLMNPDGSGFHTIALNTSFEAGPKWSPDSKRIAYSCDVNASTRGICVIDVDGSNAHTVVTLPGENSDVSWVPRSSSQQ